MHNFYMLTGGNNYGTYTNPTPNPSNALTPTLPILIRTVTLATTAGH